MTDVKLNLTLYSNNWSHFTVCKQMNDVEQNY